MRRLEYLDFELRIERDGDGYRARVLNSPSGQATHRFELPLTRDRIELIIMRLGQMRRRATTHTRSTSTELSAAREIGGALYKSAFSDDVRACFRSSLERAYATDETGLRIKLRLDDVPELADLPWELLLDSAGDKFVAQSVHTPIVRYLDLPQSANAAAVQPPLHVLVMVASPIDHQQLDVEHEKELLEKALAPLERRGMLAVSYLEKPTLKALRHALRSRPVHIFHYVGHGAFDEEAGEGILVLEDEHRRGERVDAHRIATMLHDCRSLRLAVLNACEGARVSRTDPYAGVATTLVRQGVPAVIAMQFEITDGAALTFADELYTALAEGAPVDAALAEARKAIYAMPNDIEWGTPVLYMRSANGVLFDIPPESIRYRPSHTEQDAQADLGGADTDADTDADADAGLTPPVVESHSRSSATRPFLGGGRVRNAAIGLALTSLVAVAAVLWHGSSGPTEPPAPTPNPTSSAVVRPRADTSSNAVVQPRADTSSSAVVQPRADTSSGTFIRRRPNIYSADGADGELGDLGNNVDYCAYEGGIAVTCITAYQGEIQPVRRRYMERIKHGKARLALTRVGSVSVEGAQGCTQSGTIAMDGPCTGNEGYSCLVEAEAGLARVRAMDNGDWPEQGDAAKTRAESQAAWERACRCDAHGAALPVPGGTRACTFKGKRIVFGEDLNVDEANDIVDCSKCDHDTGEAACKREIERLRERDERLARYIESIHVPRCKQP